MCQSPTHLLHGHQRKPFALSGFHPSCTLSCRLVIAAVVTATRPPTTDLQKYIREVENTKLFTDTNKPDSLHHQAGPYLAPGGSPLRRKLGIMIVANEFQAVKMSEQERLTLGGARGTVYQHVRFPGVCCQGAPPLTWGVPPLRPLSGSLDTSRVTKQQDKLHFWRVWVRLYVSRPDSLYKWTARTCRLREIRA